MPDRTLDPELWEFWGIQRRLKLIDAAWVICDEVPPPLVEKQPMPRRVEYVYKALVEDLDPIEGGRPVVTNIPPRWVGGPDGYWTDQSSATHMEPCNVRDDASRDELIAWCTRNEKKAAAWFPESRPKSHNKQADRKTRPDTYLNTIGALLEFIKGGIPEVGEFPKTEQHPSFESEARLIRLFVGYYGQYPGVSKKTLEDLFGKAKVSINGP